MSLSPAAAALEADLCLLTRLPLPKEADLDAIKERVFGSVEGVPRTEDESRRRYVDAIVEAFNASEAESLDDFPLWVRDLANGRGTLISTINALNAEMLHRNGLTAKLRQERDQARSDADRYGEGLKAAGANRRTERKDQEQLLAEVKAERDAFLHERDEALAERDKAHERIKRLQEINERLETRNREATQAGASFGVETCGLLAENDAEIERLRAEHKDLVIVRRRANDLEVERDRLTAENRRLFDALEASDRARDQIALKVSEHEETLAVLRNVNADLFKAQQDLREARDESKRWHDYGVSLHAKWEKTEQERDALKACRATDKEVWAEKTKRIETLNTALTHAREEAKTAHDALTAEQGRTERLRAVMVDLIADLNAAKEGVE